MVKILYVYLSDVESASKPGNDQKEGHHHGTPKVVSEWVSEWVERQTWRNQEEKLFDLQ